MIQGESHSIKHKSSQPHLAEDGLTVLWLMWQ